MAKFFAIILALWINAGAIYWIYLSYVIGSWWMFFSLFFPLTTPFAAFGGMYAIFFGVPNWVYEFYT